MQWSFLESFTEDPSKLFKKKTAIVPNQQKTCTPGEKYVSTTDECVPCEDGTYQNATSHTLTSCIPHEQITCEPSKMLNQTIYDNKKLNKIEPIKYEDVCNDDSIYIRLKSLKDGLDNNDRMNITQNDIINMLTYQKFDKFRLSQDVVPYDKSSLNTVKTPIELDKNKPTKTVIIGKTENVENGYNRIVNLAEVELYDDQGQLIKIDANNVSGEPIKGVYADWAKNLVDGIYRNFATTGDSGIPDGRKITDEQEKQHFKIVLTQPTVISKIVIVDREKGWYSDRLKKVKIKLLSEDATKHFETSDIPDDIIGKGYHKYIYDFNEKAWKKENIDLSKSHPLAGYQIIRHQAAPGNPIMYGHPGNNKAVAIENGVNITKDNYWLFEPIESKANTYRLKAVNKNAYMTYVGDGRVWYSIKPDFSYNILFESVGNDNYVMSRPDNTLGKVYFGYNRDGYMQAKNERDHGSDVSKFANDSIRVIVQKPPIKRSGDTGWRKSIGETYTCINESKPNIGCNNASGQGVDWKDDSQCPEGSYMYCY